MKSQPAPFLQLFNLLPTSSRKIAEEGGKNSSSPLSDQNEYKFISRNRLGGMLIWLGFVLTIMFVYVEFAQGLQPFAMKKGRWQLEGGHKGFHTFGNYDDAGDYQPLPPSSFYQSFSGYGTLTYDVFDFWSMGASVDGAFARSLNGANEKTSLYLNSVQVDTMLLWRNYFIWFAPQVIGVVPLVRNELDTDNVMIGEGAVEQTIKLNMFKPFSRVIHGFGHVGYTFRDEGRANVVPLGLGMRFRLFPLWYGFQVDGIRTATGDIYTSRASARQNATLRVNGGSYKYFSINPEYTRTEVFTEWAPTRSLSTRANFGLSWQGKNYAQEYYWGLSVTYAFGGYVDDPKYRELVKKEEEHEKLMRKRDRKFRPKHEQEDPSLFLECAPVWPASE